MNSFVTAEELRGITGRVHALALETGAYIAHQRENFHQGLVQEKSLNQLVSYVDITAEEMLCSGLRKIMPEAGFMTEENTAAFRGEEFRWIVDPLDGTTNFIHGLPVYSISVALAQGNTLLSGVVYNVPADEAFTAWKGGGAMLNGKPIRVSETPKLEQSLVATGFPYSDFGNLNEYLGVLTQLMRGTRGLRRFGSAAVDLAWVAMGRFDAFFEYGLNPWDVAAGALLVQEAGGKVTEFAGGDHFVTNGTIMACNAAMFDEFAALVSNGFQPKG